MKHFRLFPILVLVIFTLSIFMPQAFTAQASAPTITSDYPDYPPGALVTLTGTDWAPGEEVGVYVNDTANKTWEWRGTAVASQASETDPGGRFTLSFTLPTWFVANYTVTATGAISGTATTTFTDLSIGGYDQCSNDDGDGYASGDTGCKWINGNLQSNNSVYSEGDATVQRLWLTEFTPGTTHTVTFKYGTTKGGQHAYDYLTGWNWSENWISLADRCQDITGCESAAETTLPIPMDPNVPDSIEPPSAGRFFTMRGGSLVSATTPAIVSGSYAGDSETVITVTFTVGSSTGSMCEAKQGVTTCGVAFWFGAHVALTADWTIYNGTTGAGTISGSPYHVALDATDGTAVGQRDNQMQSGTVVTNGTLRVIKDAVPNDPQDFNYKLTGGVATDLDFALDDDTNATLPNSLDIKLPPGSFTLAEGALPAGWTFTSLVCSDPTSNTTVSGQTASINLASSETVVCTYTNTKSGRIIVKKVIAGEGAEPGQTFTFDPSWSSSNFTLTGGQSNDSGPLLAGTYSVAESDPGSKWTLSSATCDDGSPITAISLQNGETVTCTFTNTRLWNQDLTVSKTAVPVFKRTFTWDITKEVDLTKAKIAKGGSATFNYTVGVTHDIGTDGDWTLTGEITVSNPNDFAVEGVDLTDTVPDGTCTVTNGTNLSIPAKDSIKRTYSCTFDSAPGKDTNTATASWNAGTYNTPHGSAQGSAAYDFSLATPTVVNSSVTVTDTLGGSLGTVYSTDPSPTTFVYQQIFNGVDGTCTRYDNTASITENGDFASQSVEVCVGLDLVVKKTAFPAFTRTWNWTIDKSPDQTYSMFAGDNVDHPYRVDVTPGFVDSAWKVTGVITVTNPNAWEDIVADVTDSVDNGGACSVTGGDDASIPAGGSVDLPYSCSYPALPADGVNTAQVTWDQAGYATPGGAASATANIDFDLATVTEIGKDITVHDNLLQGEDWKASGLAAYWQYTTPFSCPTEAGLYTNGIYSYARTNTASIDGTALSDSSTVTVNCYLLAVTKTAAGSYVEEHSWTVEKSVSPAVQNAFIGETVSYTWTVEATETVAEKGFEVTGEITVHNPSPAEIIVLLSDELDDGTAATIIPGDVCDYQDGSLTIPAESTATCTYNAAPEGRSATKNTVTATLDGREVTAEAAVTWNSTVLHAEVGLADDQNPDLPAVITDGGNWTYTEQHTCSTDAASYKATDHKYTFGENNRVEIRDGESTLASDFAFVTVNCYTPVVSKTAAGKYDERHEWGVEKSVNISSQNGFAGDTLPFTWTIVVTEDVIEEAFNVAGDITVVNPAPMSLTVELDDTLDDGTPVIPTACSGEGVELSGSSLTLPANTTAVCAYSVDLTGRTVVSNTATITLGSVDLIASDAVEWSANVIRGSVTLDDDQNPDLPETITDGGSWTYEDSYTCLEDKSQYTENYSYTTAILNTATLKSGNYEQSSTSSTSVSCFIPEVSKTAAGTYTERHEWVLTKTVSPVSQSAFAGDTVSYTWTVGVDETVYEENFAVSGQITVVNHNPEDDMTVSLSDVLDSTTATITGCSDDADLADGLTVTVAKAGTAVCDYHANLNLTALSSAPTSNTATVGLNELNYTASDPIEWKPTILRGSVSLDDDQNPDLPETLTGDGTWTYAEQYTCSIDKSLYEGDNTYSFGESNTAVLKEGETPLASAEASLTIDCYVPTISKDANGKYDEVHDWEVFKSVNTASQTAFAGEKKNFSWTVRVDETTHGENYLVSGKITVVNPNPEDALVVELSDSLNDGSVAAIGPCTGGTWSSPNLTVPAGGTAICDYSVTPKGDLDAFAAALPNQVTMKVTYPYAGGPAYFPVTTVSGDADLNGTYEGWCADIDHTISENTAYTANVYSSYEGLPAGIIEKSYNLDLVNWIINQDYVGKPAGGSLGNYTFGDVQRAIWELIEDNGTANTNGLTPWNQTRANQIKAAAIANGEGFVPSCGDFVVVILQPVGGQQLVALAQVTFASLGINCAESNVVTAVLNDVEYPATKQILWTINKINETASLDDDQKPGWPVTINADFTETYTDPQGFTCPTNPSAYTNGIYQYNETNTAVLTFSTGSDTAAASTAVKCHAPVVSKTAVGTYDERHEWDVTKTVSPQSQDVLAGSQGNFQWSVSVTENVVEEHFAVSGTISVKNPRTDDGNMTVKLSDALGDGFAATISGCTNGTWNATNKTVAVPPNTIAVCSYTANPLYLSFASAATMNTVTAELMAGTTHLVTGANAAIQWSANVIRGSASLDDDQNPALPQNITEGGVWTYNDSYTCSTDQLDYTNGPYTLSENNTATVTSGDRSKSASASTDITCHAPVVTKDATTYWNRDWDWKLTKDWDKAYNLFAGNSVTHEYEVTVTPSYTDNFWGVKGTITITNSHPTEAMTLTSLSDLAGGIVGEVTCESLVVPAAGSLTCSYDTGPQNAPDDNPFGVFNTATAVFAGKNWTGNADILFKETPTSEDEPVITVDDDNVTGEVWSANRVEETWRYTRQYACSADPTKYADGKYTYSQTNTATINETGQTDTAKVDVTCHAPVVTKDATTYWNRDWDWKLTKDWDKAYNLFAGDTVTHDYKVTVTPSYTDNFWGVKGNITITNSHPTEAMTLTSLSDLAGGIVGEVTCESLVVPAAGSLTCSYDTGPQTAANANPFGDTNAATAVFAGSSWTGEAQIIFSAVPTTEDEPVITVDDDNLIDESWSANRKSGEWTYTKDFTCSTNPAEYTDGKYTYSLTNTATINETEQTDTAKVDVSCYWPQIELTKTGDKLSKIGDDVTYSITLDNNTPAGAGLRDLACSISDPLIGVSRDVILASGTSDVFTKGFTIPDDAGDPFINTASVSCKPVDATAPVVGNTTFSVSDQSTWSTNLFQPGVEIVKTGPLYATSGDIITYTFTITNLSSSDSPNLVLDELSDDVLGDLLGLAPAVCDELAAGESCTFTVKYTVPDVGLQAIKQKNIVTVHYHPAGFPNDVWDNDDHTVTITPRGQLTDTSYCPLPNNQFRLLYRLYQAPNLYLLNGSNPGQFYYNAFYFGEPGSAFTMSIEIPYPFVTQEGAGNPIQVHDGTALTGGGCFAPTPALSGFTINTEALTPTSSAGNQIITPEDYSVKQIGETTTVVVSGNVPATGFAYVTIHLDYGLKKSQPWKPAGTFTTNPVTGASLGDLTHAAGFGSGSVTIKGVQPYTFSRAIDGSEPVTTAPESYNEIKKFAGFLGFVNGLTSEAPVSNVKVEIYDPKGVKLTTLYTDEDGYYMFLYKHTAKSATYTIKLPNHGRSVSVTVKANGFAAVDFEVP